MKLSEFIEQLQKHDPNIELGVNYFRDWIREPMLTVKKVKFYSTREVKLTNVGEKTILVLS